MFSRRGAVMNATLEDVAKKKPEPTTEELTAENKEQRWYGAETSWPHPLR
jgi:hypothetical protein